MKKKIVVKLLATALAFAVCFTGINFGSLIQGREVQAARKLEEQNYQKYLQDTKVEIKEERSENQTVFQLADGTKELVLHSEPVRYKDDDGKLVDYEPMLVDISASEKNMDIKLDQYAYKNKIGDMKNYIPESLDQETPIRMEKEDMAISIAPVYEEKQTAFEETENLDTADAIVQEYTDSYDVASMETMGVAYTAEDETMELRYYSFSSGIKEAIILNEKPENNEFVFQLDLERLTPVYNEEIGSVRLYGDDSDEPEAFIEAPYMVDAEDNYSEDLYYQVEENESGGYLLRLVVSQEYLDNAVYPIEIDPTTTWRTDPYIKDTYIINGSTYGTTNFFDSDITLMSVGNASQGICRTLMKMENFKATIKGYCVTSAKLYMYESGSNHSEGNVIQVRYLTEGWALDTVNWNEQPMYSAAISSVTTKGVINTELAFDITSYARKIACNTVADNGLMLRNADESSKYNKFYGSRNTVTSKRPKIVVTYVVAPTAPTAVNVSPTCVKPGGIYTINWSGISTSYLSHVQYRVANSSGTNVTSYTSANKLGTTASGSSSLTVPYDWISGTYTVYVRGVDTGGITGGEKGVSLVVDGNIPSLPNPTLLPSTSETNYSSSLPAITWSAADSNFKDIYFTTNTGATWFLLSTSKSGSLTLPASSFPTSGKYKINLRAYDKAGNYATSGSVYYYYDATAPLFKQLEMSPDACLESKPSKNTTPTMTWLFEENEAISLIQCSIDGGEYFDIGTTISGSYTIPEGKLAGVGEHTIAIRAIDSAGNVSEVGETSYWLDDTRINMNDYVITDANITNFYGKNVIRWTNRTEVSDQMEIRVYRSEQSGFIPSEDNLVYEGVAASYWADMDESGKTYYYRIAMICKNVNGVVVEERLYDSELVGSSTEIKPSTEIRSGILYWADYYSFVTPIGTGSIERSSGNLNYTQTDFEISNSQLIYGLTRNYNSANTISGTFGRGWTDSWHMELYTTGENESLYLLLSDGTVYTFVKNTSGYSCVENQDYTLAVIENGWLLQDKEHISYRFNAFGQMIEMFEPNNNTVSYVYDVYGRLSEIVSNNKSRAEKKIQLQYPTSTTSLANKVILLDGTYITYEYTDECLIATKHFNKDGSLYVGNVYTYDTAGCMTSLTDAVGNVYGITYNSGKVTQILYPNQDKVTIDYTASETIVSEYDNNRNLLAFDMSTSDALAGKILSFTDNNGNVTTYQYTYESNPLLVTAIASDKDYQYLDGTNVVFSSKKVTETRYYDAVENIIKINDCKFRLI